MSRDAYREFLRKVRQDAGLQKELWDRFGDAVAGIPVERLAEFAAGKGYRFTVEEASGLLGDEELDGVSGGLVDPYQRAQPLKGNEPGTLK